MNRKHATKLELLQVAGCLIHCAQVFPQGKPFLRLIFSKAHSVRELHFRVNLNNATRKDLRWWHDVLSEWCGISILARGNWVEDLVFTSDAAGSVGFGIWTCEEWCAEKWPESVAGNTNIAILEMLPLVLAASLWGCKWSGLRVLFRSDNMSVVWAVNKGMPKEPQLLGLVKQLAKLSILHSFQYRCVHIPGVNNTEADLLSRGRIGDFLDIRPDLAGCRLRVESTAVEDLLRYC